MIYLNKATEIWNNVTNILNINLKQKCGGGPQINTVEYTEFPFAQNKLLKKWTRIIKM